MERSRRSMSCCCWCGGGDGAGRVGEGRETKGEGAVIGCARVGLRGVKRPSSKVIVGSEGFVEPGREGKTPVGGN